MKRYLWALLPLATLWIVYPIGFHLIYTPTEWWMFPLIISLAAVFIVSLSFALNKIFDYGDK
jgi:hypothetical protein